MISYFSPPNYLDIIFKPSPTSPFPGQVKVSNLTPEKRSPGRMGYDEDCERTSGLGKREKYVGTELFDFNLRLV